MKNIALVYLLVSLTLSTPFSIGTVFASPTDVIVYNDVGNRTVGVAIRGDNIVLADCPPGEFIERFDLCTNEKATFRKSDLPRLILESIRESVRDSKRFDQLDPLAPLEVEALVSLPSDAAVIAATLPKLEKEAANFRKLLQIMPGATGYQEQLTKKESEIATAKALSSALRALDRIVASVIDMIAKPELTPFVARMNANKLIAPLFTKIVNGKILAISSAVVNGPGRPSAATIDVAQFSKCVDQISCDIGDVLRANSAANVPDWNKGWHVKIQYRCSSAAREAIFDRNSVAPYAISCN